MSTPITVPAGQDIRDSWQWRVLAETEGTMAHYVFRAMLGHTGGGYPRVGHAGKILKDGVVVCKIATAADAIEDVRLDHVEKIRDRFRRVADAIKLTDAEREGLFTLLRQWLAEDQRAQSGLEAGHA